jgi:hypothetical protein
MSGLIKGKNKLIQDKINGFTKPKNFFSLILFYICHHAITFKEI